MISSITNTRMPLSRLFMLSIIVLLLSVSLASTVSAQVGPRLTFNVNNNGDGRDLSIDGICDVDPGPGVACSLRAALQEAQAAGAATINIPAMTVLTAPETIDQFVTGDFDIFGGNIVLQGAGQGITVISGNNINRVFEIFSGAVIMRDLTITAGASSADGGGIYARNNVYLRLERVTVSGNTAAGWGGGVTQGPNSTVEVFDSRITSNTADQIGGIGPIFGDPGTTLTIVNTEIAQNSSVNGSVGGVYSGVGAFTITNSTISSNGAPNGSSAGIEIGTGAGSSATVTHVTITGNSANGLGGGMTVTGSVSPAVRNTIVAGNTAIFGPDCFTFSANVAVQGVVNFGNTDFCGITNFGAVITGSPQLGPLGFNGAATRHHVPQIGSPVVNAATGTGAAYCTPTDQLGQARPRGTYCDLGAIERAVGIDAVLVSSSATVVAGGPNPLNTLTLTVTDPDQPAGPSVNLIVTSTNGSPESETIVLPSLGGGVYSAAVTVSAGAITPGNGILEAAIGDILNFAYTDIFGDSAGPETFNVAVTAIPLGVAGQISVSRLTVVPKSDAPYFEQNQIDVTYVDPDLAGSGSIVVTITDLQDDTSVTSTLGELPGGGTFVRTFSFRTDVTLSIGGAVIRAVPGHTVEFRVTDNPDGMAGSTDRTAVVTVIDEGVTGILSSTPAEIQPGDPVTITLVDPDTNAASYPVTLTTPAGDSETFNVPSTGLGQYSLQVNTAAGLPAPGDGTIQVSIRDVLTFEAVDFKDGSGGVSTLKAETVVAFNLLVNGSFENEFGDCLLDPWTASSSADKVVAKNPYQGSCAFRFKGDPSRDLAQMVLIQKIVTPASGFVTGDIVTVSAWIDTKTPTNGQLKLVIKYSDDKKQLFRSIPIEYDNDSLYNQTVAQTILDLTGGRTITKFLVRFNDRSLSGKWFVDAVELLLTHPSDTPVPRPLSAPDGLLPPPAAPGGFRGAN